MVHGGNIPLEVGEQVAETMVREKLVRHEVMVAVTVAEEAEVPMLEGMAAHQAVEAARLVQYQ